MRGRHTARETLEQLRTEHAEHSPESWDVCGNVVRISCSCGVQVVSRPLDRPHIEWCRIGLRNVMRGKAA
jgi:hypothetical protein